ncbi:hypothetical protein LCGC14_0688660 [marine sediment metagenome]|uniref:histidine kinase n=1 Tax=marine sediment metagenome TaxID=412755 RepID=A0A0F9QQZ2_9ZZZZ|nr:HAMP domain-containing protein [Candidatus Aminicenantes bacterium]HEB34756.1 HAMP domain-containing protein [Candidatus Aminicenantes bacterium]
MNFRIREKLLSGFIIILVLFTGTIIFAIQSIRSLYDNVQKTHNHPLAVTRASQEIEVMVTSMHRSMKDVSLSYDKAERDRYIALVSDYEKEALLQFDIVQKQILGDEGQALALNARQIFIKWKPIRQRVIALVETGKYTQAQEITRTEGADYVEFIMTELHKLPEYAADKALRFNEESADIAIRARTVTISALILSCFLGISAALFLSLSITRRLSTISRAATKMAGGNLKQALEVKGRDELSQMAKNFNSMAGQLSASHEMLEEKIKERTIELEKTNRQLLRLQRNLEKKVSARTKELKEKVQKLNKSQKAMLLMVEDLNKTSRELKGAQEELVRKEKLSILGQLAGGVGHELRNPLGVISNAVYYLKTLLPDASKTTREYLEMISSEVLNSEKIISDLLDLSRTNPSAKEVTAVSELVTQVLDRRAPPEKIKVTTEMAPKLPSVFVDGSQLGQVIDNLVLNAYQAMSDEGKLTIKAKAVKDKVYISITDTGCGIPKENMKKLFEPLFTAKARGIGLGLSVSKNLAEANGGKIEVKSEEGKGSTFTVILPTKEVKG